MRSYEKVAVAFSGGVDSTLLLRVACDTLGRENVTALHAVSCLIPVPDRIKAENLVSGPNGIHCLYRAIAMDPLSWQEFVVNSEQRCYLCKKRMYGILQTMVRQDVHNGCSSQPQNTSMPIDDSGTGRQMGARVISGAFLVDGTNTDDLQEHRPGLVAIRELAVGTPLAQVRLDKKDVRSLARQMGLVNWNQPSNSCLATRIGIQQKITLPLLERIARAEQFLHEKGLAGIRVKTGHHKIMVQVLPDDMGRCSVESFRLETIDTLQHLGFSSFTLEIASRKAR